MDVTRCVESQQVTPFTMNVRHQLIRSSSSVGANYHEACRARSRKEFISKLEIVIQELDETDYWLRMMMDYGGKNRDVLQDLLKETDELTAIMTASSRTAKLSRKPHR